MSTNYYLDSPDNEAGHLGHWAGGRFTAYAPPGVDSYADWAAQLDGRRIFTENGVEVTTEEMLTTARTVGQLAYLPRVMPSEQMRFIDKGVLFVRYQFC